MPSHFKMTTFLQFCIKHAYFKTQLVQNLFVLLRIFFFLTFLDLTWPAHTDTPRVMCAVTIREQILPVYTQEPEMPEVNLVLLVWHGGLVIVCYIRNS